MSDSKVLPAMSGRVGYRDPAVEPPPRGIKLLILTSGNVAIVSDWSDDSNHAYWSPLPPKPVRAGEPVQWTEEPDHG